jgi:hypothetical protein
MPAPNHLNSEQKEKLQKALKEEENPALLDQDMDANCASYPQPTLRTRFEKLSRGQFILKISNAVSRSRDALHLVNILQARHSIRQCLRYCTENV